MFIVSFYIVLGLQFLVLVVFSPLNHEFNIIMSTSHSSAIIANWLMDLLIRSIED